MGLEAANIYLTGFMGAGKTSVGRLLATELGALYYDTDQIIIGAQGMSIEEIFKIRGEEYFRDKETELLRLLGKKTAGTCIISTGGGIVKRLENRALMSKNGLVVFLHISTEEACRRLSGVQNRPLLNTPDPIACINELLQKRRPFYQEAHITVETSNITVRETVNKIVSAIGRWKYAGRKEEITGTTRPQP